MMKISATSRLLKLAILAFALLLMYTQATDADLIDVETIADNTFNAIQMDVANLSTANESQRTQLFSEVGFLPGGFQVESLRIANEGDVEFTTSITTQLTTSHEGLCPALDLVVMNNYKKIYDDSLQGFSLQRTVGVDSNDDLVFFISLPEASDSLKNTTCNFNFVVTIIDQETGQQRPGLWDVEVVQSSITTGTWASE